MCRFWSARAKVAKSAKKEQNMPSQMAEIFVAQQTHPPANTTKPWLVPLALNNSKLSFVVRDIPGNLRRQCSPSQVAKRRNIEEPTDNQLHDWEIVPNALAVT